MRKHPKICLVSFFFHKAFSIPLSNIRRIILEIDPESHSIITTLPELSEKIIFDSKKDEVIIYKNQINPLFNALNYLLLNLKMSWSIIQKSEENDYFLFFMETGLPIPMIIAKIVNKRIIWLLPSSFEKMTAHNRNLSDSLLIHMQSLSYTFADIIVLYSPNLIKEWELDKYSEKILIAHEHFVNTERFSISIPLINRPVTIGYIGRLSSEKGVLNFIDSLPLLFNDRKDFQVFIGGDGQLKEEIEASLREKNLASRVNLSGWISHDDLPRYLNQIQLLVIPSYIEGLPNILLEAMACGTPVLSTSVGAIPDIIKDGQTGFIMENNSPACIAENIIRATGNSDLKKIALNARKIVEEKFSFERTVEDWKRIFK